MTRRTRTHIVVAAALSGFGIVQPVGAAEVYWDVNGTTAGASGDGITPTDMAAGTWDTATANWNPLADGTGTTATWVDNDVPVFSAGTNATGAYVIDVTANHSVSGMTFEEGGTTVASPLEISSTNASSLTLTGTPVINVSASAFPRMNVQIAGSVRWTKTGPGTFYIPSAKTYTGGIDLNEGTLMVFAEQSLGVNPASPAAGANYLVFNGGTLRNNNGQGSTAITISSNRGIVVNAAGATFDCSFNPSNPNTHGSWIYNGTNGGVGHGLSGTGTITKKGFNLLVFGGNNSAFTGKYNVLAGTVQSNNTATADGFGATPLSVVPDYFTLNGGGIRVGPTSYTIATTRGITLGASGGFVTIANAGSALTIDSVITGAGSFSRTQTNLALSPSTTLTLNGANDYTGATVIDAGTTNANGSSALGAASGSLTVNNANTGAATSVVLNLSTTAGTTKGSLSGTIAAPVSGNTATINNGGQLFTVNQTTPGTFQGVIAGTGGFTLGGGSTSTLTLTGNNTYIGGTTVEAGTLEVKKMHAGNAVSVNGGTLRILESDPGYVTGFPAGDNAMVSQPSALSVAPGAVLDITNNDIVLDYTGASPVATYEALVASGYNLTGDWQGDGIVSSIAAIDGNYIVAIADNATLAAPFGTANGGPLFAGVDVDLDTILIKFTHRADINLDGVVTPDDSAVFGGNYDENQPATWATGDMNYDGIFTPDDAAIFGGAYDESLASLPEPGSIGVAALLGLGLAGQRRRRSR